MLEQHNATVLPCSFQCWSLEASGFTASQCKALEHVTDVLPQSIRMQNAGWCCNPQSGWIQLCVCVSLCWSLCAVYMKLASKHLAVQTWQGDLCGRAVYFLWSGCRPQQTKSAMIGGDLSFRMVNESNKAVMSSQCSKSPEKAHANVHGVFGKMLFPVANLQHLKRKTREL